MLQHQVVLRTGGGGGGLLEADTKCGCCCNHGYLNLLCSVGVCVVKGRQHSQGAAVNTNGSSHTGGECVDSLENRNQQSRALPHSNNEALNTPAHQQLLTLPPLVCLVRLLPSPPSLTRPRTTPHAHNLRTHTTAPTHPPIAAAPCCCILSQLLPAVIWDRAGKAATWAHRATTQRVEARGVQAPVLVLFCCVAAEAQGDGQAHNCCEQGD